MRVLHVIPSLSPVHGGPSTALPVMERALTAAGVDVETATTDDNGAGQRARKPLGVEVCENGVTRWYFPKQTEFYKVSLPLQRWLKNEISRFDVVHIHALFSFTSVAAARTARRAGVPYVIRPLGLLNRYGMTQRRARLKRVSFHWLEGPLLRDAAAVHFTSLDEQAEAKLLDVPMSGVVIPLGVEFTEPGDPEEFFSCYPVLRKQRRILFLSRLDPKKNLESLLQALAAIRPDFPDAMLIICGDGAEEYVIHLKQLGRNLGIDESLVWTGRVEGRQKAAAFASADVFMLPSLSENFGIAAVEALGAGLPCVLARGVAVAADAQAAGAAVLVASSPDAIAKGLRFALGDIEWRRSAGERARQLATTTFSSSKMGESLIQLYRRAIAL